MDFFSLLFSPSGRIGRLSYFGTCFFLAIASRILDAFATPFEKSSSAMDWVIPIMLNLIMLYVYFCVGVKRAHDFDKSGWWLTGWGMISILASIGLVFSAGAQAIARKDLSAAIMSSPLAMLCGVLLLVSFFQTVLRMLFASGTDGDNRFGEPNGTGPVSSSPSSGRRMSRMELLNAQSREAHSPSGGEAFMGASPAPAQVGMPRSGPAVFGRRATAPR